MQCSQILCFLPKFGTVVLLNISKHKWNYNVPCSYLEVGVPVDGWVGPWGQRVPGGVPERLHGVAQRRPSKLAPVPLPFR